MPCKVPELFITKLSNGIFFMKISENGRSKQLKKKTCHVTQYFNNLTSYFLRKRFFSVWLLLFQSIFVKIDVLHCSHMCHVYFVSWATVVRMKYMLQIQSIISMIKDLETPKNKFKKKHTNRYEISRYWILCLKQC